MKKALIIIALAGGTFAMSAMGAPVQLISQIFNFNANTAKLVKPVAGFPQTVSGNRGNASYVLPKVSELPVTVTYIVNSQGQGCAFTFEQDKNQTKFPPYGYKITARGVGGFSDNRCQNDTGVLTIN